MLRSKEYLNHMDAYTAIKIRQQNLKRFKQLREISTCEGTRQAYTRIIEELESTIEKKLRELCEQSLA